MPEGIPVDEAYWQALLETASELGVAPEVRQ